MHQAGFRIILYILNIQTIEQPPPQTSPPLGRDDHDIDFVR